MNAILCQSVIVTRLWRVKISLLEHHERRVDLLVIAGRVWMGSHIAGLPLNLT